MTNISFISGTRADYGKIKPYIDFLCEEKDKNIFIFTTGMNMLKKYGSTYKFIKEDLKKSALSEQIKDLNLLQQPLKQHIF